MEWYFFCTSATYLSGCNTQISNNNKKINSTDTVNDYNLVIIFTDWDFFKAMLVFKTFLSFGFILPPSFSRLGYD